MRLFILYMIYGVVAIALESTWLSALPTARYHFDFLLIAVAFLGFSQEWRRAVPIVVIFGIMYDVSSAAPFGIALVSYLAIYSLLRLIITKIAYQTLIARFGWIAIASAMDKSVCAGLLLLWGYPVEVAKIFVMRAPIQALIDSCLGLALVPFLAWYSELRWNTLFRPKGLVMDR